jgi:hypothetical protein
MVKKTQEPKKVSEDKIFKTWADSYSAFSTMWEDSYVKLYKPWIESSEEMFEKTVKLSKDATPQKYREFYDEWQKTYQNTFGKFCPLPEERSNKEILEKFMVNAKGLNEQYRAWMAEFEENSGATREVLQGKPDPEKYKEVYDQWMRSYEKIFDELLELPFKESTKEIFGNNREFPDIYSGAFLKMSKLYKRSYQQLCKPFNESMRTLSDKMNEISRGNASPEAYKEFYTLWMDTYKDISGKYASSMEPSGENLANFVDITHVYLGLYKSWITALEKMSEKAQELSKQTSDPGAYKEFYNLWVTTYEKAFDSFFEDMPTVEGPMKEAMEPVKTMAKLYADTFIKMSKMWVRSDSRSASAYPGKNKK